MSNCCLNDDTSNINIYVGEDGKLHFTDKDGADSVLNFSKGKTVTKYSYTGCTSGFTLEQTNLSGNPEGSGMFLFLTNIPNYQSLSINDMIIVPHPCCEKAQAIYTFGYLYYASTGRLIIYPNTASCGRFARSTNCKCEVYVLS